MFRAILILNFGVQSHHIYPFRHLESSPFRVLTFRVIPSHLYHSESQAPTFISTSIAHVAFMDLHLSSFSSPCHHVLIAYSSLSFHISLLTAYDDVLSWPEWLHASLVSLWGSSWFFGKVYFITLTIHTFFSLQCSYSLHSWTLPKRGIFVDPFPGRGFWGDFLSWLPFWPPRDLSWWGRPD